MADMSEVPTGKSYTGTAKTLHWVMAFLVLLMLAAGSQMLDMTDAQKTEATMGHTAAGLIVLTLLIVRFVYRRRNPPPPLPQSMPAWQHTAALLNHRAFYVLILIQAIAGIGAAATAPYEVASFGVIPLSALAAADPVWFSRFVLLHQTGALGILGLALLHIGAALNHHFIQKDNILRRMWPRAVLKPEVPETGGQDQ